MSDTELVMQAAPTVIEYHIQIEDHLDKRYGSGYAKENPVLVAGLVKACAMDFATASLSKRLDKLAGAIDSSIGGQENLAPVLEGIREALEDMA